MTTVTARIAAIVAVLVTKIHAGKFMAHWIGQGVTLTVAFDVNVARLFRDASLPWAQPG